VDRFAALGLPRKFAVSGEALEGRFRELSRKLHPDRFAKGTAEERVASAQATTTLNDAYRALKQPVVRATYLLELEGFGLGEGDRVAPEFLQEILELREALEEAKARGDRAELDRLGADMKARRRAAVDEIARLFEPFDARGDKSGFPAIKDRLIALRYFDRFLEAHEGAIDEES
jgi:molecular chaperone HscB